MKSKKSQASDIHSLLKSAGAGRNVFEYDKKGVIFSQGDPADNVLYLQRGAVELSVISRSGKKKAIVAILRPGDFFGLWCLSGFPLRMATARAIAPTNVLIIDKRKLLQLLHTNRAFADRFVSFLLKLNIRIERDLLDLHFNPAEKRLARKLLLLSRYGIPRGYETNLPEISQDMLAKMVGTTRARVSLFMNKFRRLGLIEYNGTLKVRRSLVNVILHS